MTDPELRDLHRGAREERRRLTPAPEPAPEPTTAEHDCRDHLTDERNLSDCPLHTVTYTCGVCGRRVDFDVLTGEHDPEGDR
jgi:hypothetical protein